jgi:hypothetical protein
MQNWWLVHPKKMTMQFSDEDKAELEDTIGNLPILLNVILEIKLNDLEDAETQAEEDVTE